VKRSYGVAHLQMLALDPPAFVDAASRCGYDAVGLRIVPATREERPYPLATDKALLRATKARMNAVGVICNDIEICRLSPDIEPESYQAVLEAGAELGARSVTVQLPDPETSRAIDRFGRLSAMARPLGLHLAIEFLPWSEVSNLAAAAKICAAVDADNAGILVDTLHFHRSASTIAELQKLPRTWLRMLHLADCPSGTPTTSEALIHTARRKRLLPGAGLVEFASILQAMPADVLLTLEIPHDRRVSEVGMEGYSRMALDVTRRHIESLQGRASSNAG